MLRLTHYSNFLEKKKHNLIQEKDLIDFPESEIVNITYSCQNREIIPVLDEKVVYLNWRKSKNGRR